uniref:Uncharacterized protein n=1 Tax=Schistocephalus solidus TaxID=70667 RepID=A0A0X3PV18_SCHSO
MTTSALVDRTSYDVTNEASEAQKLSVSACDVNKFGDSDLKNSATLAAANSLQWLKTSICDLSISTNESDEGIKTVTLSSAAIRKPTPLLANPPRLARRFADCELTGDCQVSEASDIEDLKKELRRERQSAVLTLQPVDCSGNTSELKGDQEKKSNLESRLWKFKLFSHLKIHSKKSRSNSSNGQPCEVVERVNHKLQMEMPEDEEFEATDTEPATDNRRPDQDDISTISDSVGSKPKMGSTLNFRPRADIFHLLNNMKHHLLVRRPSFFSVSESSVDSSWT